MRLNRLDLTRYGRFTDDRIDFGEWREGKPDLHIIYGPNEAGKSTALAAFLDLLFKIEPKSTFNFLHPHNVMRVGASLELAGRNYELVRVKRTQNDLLDGNGSPIAEAVIAGQLGGIDRQSYRAMFSLDDETLEAGGESILASKGDLGQLLFAASSGLAGLSGALVNLRAEVEGFYKYLARGSELATLKARLAALKEAREKIDTFASKYAQLIEVRDRALTQYNEALASRTAIQSRMDEIQRYVTALPRLAVLRATRDKLHPLADVPKAPAGWYSALPKLLEAETALLVMLNASNRNVDQKSSELEMLAVDQTALKLGDRVDRLKRPLARYVTAAEDIPVRRREVREEDLAIAGILSRIGRDGDVDPQRLVFDSATVGALQDLIAKQSGIEAASQSATTELAGAQQDLEEAMARLREADAGTGAAEGREESQSSLATLAAALQGNDHAVRRRNAERSRAAHLETLAERLSALRPWRGDVEQLAAAQVPPPSEVLRWKTELDAASKKNDRCAGEVERLETEWQRLEAERDAIAQVAGVVSDQDAAGARAAREAAWATHRATLDPASADIFETALRRDDIIMDARLRHETDVAKLHQTSLSLLRVEAEARRAKELFDSAAAKLGHVRSEIAAAFAPLLPTETSIAQLEAWLGKREKVLETRADIKQAERDLRDVEADFADVRKRLINALVTAGVPHDPDAPVDALLLTARAKLDRESELKTLRAAVDEKRRTLKIRERNHTAELERDRLWCEAWHSACSDCWLSEIMPSPSLTTVRETLPAVAALGPALERRASLLDRINMMQNDQQAFNDEVVAIAGELGFNESDYEPLDLAQKLINRVQTARAALAMRLARTEELDKAREEHSKLADAHELHGRRKSEMTTYFAVGSLTEVADKLSEAGRKAGLQTQAEEAEREILDTLRLALIEDAESLLDKGDRSTLEAELAELKVRFDDQDERARALFSAHSKALDRVDAVGGDAAVAKLEEQRRTILLEIEDGALQYLKLRVGIVAAEHALRSYRQHHRSSMMTKASEAFRTISRNAYSGLASQPNKDNEVLIAIGVDGSSKIASVLSKGTRFQLYLALRVAGYHEFARLRPPVPFIADDIMETFDNFRAEEALRLLAAMAEVGQVIYFTHHLHLCDIAQRICPDVQMHELSVVPA
jgi:uncharacterized protein YhaN